MKKTIILLAATTMIAGCQTTTQHSEPLSMFNGLEITKTITFHHSAGWNSESYFYIKNTNAFDIKSANFIAYYWGKDGLPVPLSPVTGNTYGLDCVVKNIPAGSKETRARKYDMPSTYMYNTPYCKVIITTIEDFDGNIFINKDATANIEIFEAGHKLTENEKTLFYIY